VNPNIVVMPERRWHGHYPCVVSETTIGYHSTQSWGATALQIIDESNFTGFPPIAATGPTESIRFTSVVMYRVARPFHGCDVSLEPAAGSLGITGYPPVVFVTSSRKIAAPAGLPIEARRLVSRPEATPKDAPHSRAHALTILRSWLEPHESDDQAEAFRQLKEDLDESRRGQRKLFPD